MIDEDMGMHFVDILVVSSGYLVSMKIGYSVAVVYNIEKRKLISFCVDTGFTCFGLVVQNYEISDEVLAAMGVHTILIPRAEVSKTGVNITQAGTQLNRAEHETIDITVLRRGIIGVNKIGYVPI